jgi:uncharacterized protein YbaP (TraB family)
LVPDRQKTRWTLLASLETAIVVVGKGHLVGEGSVIDLLLRRGHDETQGPAETPVGACGG